MVLSALVGPAQGVMMPSVSRISARAALSLGAIGVALIMWQVASSRIADPGLLPGLEQVLATGWQMLGTGDLTKAVVVSASRVAVGYLAGALVGIATGLLLGASKTLNRSAGIVFDFLKGIPPIAFVPIVILWLGIGEVSKYVVIAYIVWIVVTISTAVGARELPLVRARSGECLGLSRTAIFMRIVLPSCVPYIVSGMRSAIGFAFVALVSAELIGASSGIGFLIMDARFSLQTARMIVALLLLGVLGATVQFAFDLAISHAGRISLLANAQAKDAS